MLNQRMDAAQSLESVRTTAPPCPPCEHGCNSSAPPLARPGSKGVGSASAHVRVITFPVSWQVLYTGPMFQVYNTVLRRFPVAEFEAYLTGGNLFSTTIFVLVSAVVKIARVMRLPTGLELYRGLGGLAELPESFLRADRHGCWGYMEWGLLSTTSSRATAIDYSGAGEGRPLPMMITTRVGAIDRGACIKELSQYPTEVRLPYPPSTPARAFFR